MAHSTIHAFSHPQFPQVFTAVIDQLISTVPVFGDCEYESPESTKGACDGMRCGQLSTVHHLASERDLCVRHFQEVSRG